MTLGELAKTSGYTEATIKFFLRENLLPAGEKVNERLADYSDSHTQRLRLVTALHDRIGLPYNDIKSVTEVLDNPDMHVYEALGRVQRLLIPKHSPSTNTNSIQNILTTNGINPASKGYVENLAGALSEAREEGFEFDEKTISAMIQSLRQIVELEMDTDIPRLKNDDEIVRYSALGMFYTASISRQLTLMIEQTLAREAMHPKQP
jgi:DNA-binding transcriptional MerR regulator